MYLKKETMRGENLLVPNTELCERMLSPYNLEVAMQNVKRNKGSAGIDGIGVDEIDSFMHNNWKRIKEKILKRKYEPKPVKRVEIPKDNGGVRLLGIPCVIDRVIQQAMVQVLNDVFEPTFSDFSYGFRPNRSAEDAVRKAQEYMAEGYEHVIDLDLSKFFDTVNHDKLMSMVDKSMADKDIRRLIFVYLKSGVMINGKLTEVRKGTPQGGPLSPLLSNIYLTPYDKELEKRGHKFVRYADDCNIFTKSRYAAKTVKLSVIKFLENKLDLKVNMEKTEARRAVGSSFLGFKFLSRKGINNEIYGMCRPKEKKIANFKKRIVEITKRNRGVSITTVIKELNTYIRGWLSYYARANISSWLRSICEWIRRRIRQYLWKGWKTAKNRRKHLRLLGNKEWSLDEFVAYGSNNHWRVTSILGKFITNKVLFETYGLGDFENFYRAKHILRRRMDKLIKEGSLQLEFDFKY